MQETTGNWMDGWMDGHNIISWKKRQGQEDSKWCPRSIHPPARGSATRAEGRWTLFWNPCSPLGHVGLKTWLSISDPGMQLPCSFVRIFSNPCTVLHVCLSGISECTRLTQAYNLWFCTFSDSSPSPAPLEESEFLNTFSFCLPRIFHDDLFLASVCTTCCPFWPGLFPCPALLLAFCALSVPIT